jgi:hypothetical protein
MDHDLLDESAVRREEAGDTYGNVSPGTSASRDAEFVNDLP